MSANQTKIPNHIIIYDDNDTMIDLRENSIYQNIFSLIQKKGISFEVKVGKKRGQVFNHQQSIYDVGTSYIWRLDDDNSPEPTVLENLFSTIEINKTIGAVAGLVLDPKMNNNSNKEASNKIEDIYLGLNQQWFKHELDNLKFVDHLYSTFLYRVEASTHG